MPKSTRIFQTHLARMQFGRCVLVALCCAFLFITFPMDSTTRMIRSSSFSPLAKLIGPSSVLAAPNLQTTANLLSNIASIDTGSNYTCAVTNAGGVKCWGNNHFGQLGDGSNNDSAVPVDVEGYTSGVTAVQTGRGYTCILTNSGGVKCWGYNRSGELGDGSNNDSFTPVDVVGLTSGINSISANTRHICALTNAGGVKCWGNNLSGRLGDGSTNNSSTAVDVEGLRSGVSAIAAGRAHTCALTNAGGVKCWGANSGGQLGNGQTENSLTPVDVAGLTSGVSAIAAGGAHSCALTSAGGVKCWGANSSGQLGNGAEDDNSTPVDVVGLTAGVSAIAAGPEHSCALTSTDGVKCWGWSRYGQVGNGSISEIRIPTDVAGLTSGISAISAGPEHSCAVTNDGGAKCWGLNNSGQIGITTFRNYTKPIGVMGLTTDVSAVSVGLYYTCVLTSEGGVKCWGNNVEGQLGNNSTTNSYLSPVDVVGLTAGVRAVVAGWTHACALTDAGGVKCWGGNHLGQLGDGTTTNSLIPVDVAGLTSNVSVISAGLHYTCAVTTDGAAKCWGSNYAGILGNGSTTVSLTPVNVSGLAAGVRTISAGSSHTCAVTVNGGAKCWGYNGDGKLGDNSSNLESSIPVDVVGLTSGVRDISAGSSHTCALTDLGGVKCWGSNEFGELGGGDEFWPSSPLPVDVSGLTSGVSTITTGSAYSCASTTAGNSKCWGVNDLGELGNGDTDDREWIPVDVVGLSPAVIAIESGASSSHTCALTSEGGVKCWGQNEFGAVDGVAGRIILRPVDVFDPNNQPGNVNCDDKIDVVDALFTLQFVIGLRSDRGGCPLSAESINAANGDVDNRNGVTAVDALLILQCVAEQPNVLCPATGVDNQVVAADIAQTTLQSMERAITTLSTNELATSQGNSIATQIQSLLDETITQNSTQIQLFLSVMNQ